jgi:hypothetical protein
MKNNMFDPDMFKNLDKMINGLGNLTNKPLIDTKIFKKVVVVFAVTLILSGFGLGLLIGLLF